jgi:surface antigen
MSRPLKSRLLRLTAQLGLFGTLVLGAAAIVARPAAASNLGAQIAQLQAQEGALRSQLAGIQGQASSAAQQAASTQQQVAAAQARLAQGQAELAQANAALAQTNDRIGQTQAQIVLDRNQLAQLVREMYQHGNANNLSTAIADSSGVTQFFDTTLQLQTVGQQFSSLTQELTSEEAQLRTLQASQQAQQLRVTALVASFQAAANQLQAQELSFQSQASSLSGQAGQIASQIQRIASQIQTLQAEEAAISSYGGPSSAEEGTILTTFAAPAPAYPDGYPWGQCTWFVAGQTNVPWQPRGNADQWIGEDYSMGTPYAVGSTPRVDSMVVFDPGGIYDYNYGHVAWVVAVLGPTTFVVEEDNFYGYGLADQREIYTLQGVEGFIYG